MALVTFDDEQGIGWRAWHVELPSTRVHLMDAEFRGGWLVFERLDGRERRRLSRIPEDWASLPPATLAALCAEAVPVTTPHSVTAAQLLSARPPDADR